MACNDHLVCNMPHSIGEEMWTLYATLLALLICVAILMCVMICVIMKYLKKPTDGTSSQLNLIKPIEKVTP